MLSENDKYKMELKQKTPVKFLVFSGGGAKVAGCGGVHAALEDSGVIHEVEAVAGSSAGAITAAFISTGISQKTYSEALKVNFKSLLGKGFIINKDGAPLYKMISDVIRQNITSYIEENDILALSQNILEQINIERAVINNRIKAGDLSEAQIEGLMIEKEKLDKRTKQIEDIIANDADKVSSLYAKCIGGGKICFKDIALLRAIDPTKFKDLNVTAVSKDTSELKIFNAENTPDVEIALACRASASIPIVFQPVEIDGVEYVDGGYVDNIPISSFRDKNYKPIAEDVTENPEKIKEARNEGRVLAFAFGSGMDDPANVSIYSAKDRITTASALMNFITDVIFKVIAMVGGVLKYSEANERTYQVLRENSLDTIVLDTRTVSTLSFNEANRQSNYMYLKSYYQTASHLSNHELGASSDITLPHKEFFLKVYEEIDQKNQGSFWSSKVGDQNKSELISFCGQAKWENRDKFDTLLHYISIAANAPGGTRALVSPAISTIIEELNKPGTSLEVKKDFMFLMAIDMDKDPRFADKLKMEAIREFQFQTEDFAQFLVQSRGEMKRVVAEYGGQERGRA